MTDNEIIKALKDWSERGMTFCNVGMPEFARNILDLINRQKEEIERLEKRLETVQGAKCVYSYDGETVEYCVHSPCPICKTVDQIRAEAIKEFLQKVNEQKWNYGEDEAPIWVVELIDVNRIARDMTEGQNDV